MSEDIKPGDLVMVVKPMACCGNPSALGMTFHILSIVKMDCWCIHCGDNRNIVRAESPLGFGDVSRLKKIPPLTELEDITTDYPIKEKV